MCCWSWDGTKSNCFSMNFSLNGEKCQQENVRNERDEKRERSPTKDQHQPIGHKQNDAGSRLNRQRPNLVFRDRRGLSRDEISLLTSIGWRWMVARIYNIHWQKSNQKNRQSSRFDVRISMKMKSKMNFKLRRLPNLCIIVLRISPTLIQFIILLFVFSLLLTCFEPVARQQNDAVIFNYPNENHFTHEKWEKRLLCDAFTSIRILLNKMICSRKRFIWFDFAQK